MVRRSLSFFVIVIMSGLMGGCVGCMVGRDPYWRRPAPAQSDPLPHHVSKYSDGLSLRFAMVHDMIHERFPKHGQAYYQERNRVVEKELASFGSMPPEDPQKQKRYFELQDDLGAGLERLGKHEEAVALMRRKLKEQQDLKITGKDLYGAYANLGTFLILWQLSEGFADKAKAKARLEEGLGYVQKSIEVNPEAHFGREIWQAVILEFLIAALDKPEVLLQFDMIGDRLDLYPAPSGHFGRGNWYVGWEVTQYLNGKPDENLKNRLRHRIMKVGAENGWTEAVKTSHQSPVPFDEPTLGIIGMWRLGSGANPYFALAFGEIMLRVGQRYIAWTAFERAAQMAGGIWPDAKIQEGILNHCRNRQRQIESQLVDDIPAMRARFEKELAFGQRYQREYQEYEAAQIAKGVSIDDPRFYDNFDFEARNKQSIATPPGEEEFTERRVYHLNSWSNAPAAVLLFAGIFAFVASALMLVSERYSKPPEPSYYSSKPNPFDEPDPG